MIDIYVMIWHLKSLNLKTILRPSTLGGMPLKRTHVVFSLSFKCTPRDKLEIEIIICCCIYNPIYYKNTYIGNSTQILIWIQSGVICKCKN